MIQEGTSAYKEIKNLEELQSILQTQQNRIVTIDEAREVGQSLIDFFEVLADDTSEIAEVDEDE